MVFHILTFSYTHTHTHIYIYIYMCVCVCVCVCVAWKKLRFILSDRSDFHMTDSQSIADHAFAGCVLMSFSVDETLLPR